MPGVRGARGFKTPNCCCDFSLRHHSINWQFKEHTPTHSWQKADLIGRVSLASDRTDGCRKNATNGHLRNEKATAMQIAAINVDVMTTATVTIVGARRQYPRMHEHCRGSGVAQDPDKFCRRRPWSDFIREVRSGGGGVNCVDPET